MSVLSSFHGRELLVLSSFHGREVSVLSSFFGYFFFFLRKLGVIVVVIFPYSIEVKHLRIYLIN